VEISEPHQIRALASPVRQDIVDAITAVGPCSVAELATVLGRPADGLYYHVRLLVATRLLVPTGGGYKGGRGELRIDVAKKLMYVRYDPADPRNRAAVLDVVASMVRSAHRGFRRGLRPGVAVVRGPRRNLWAGRTFGALSARDLARANALLHRLIAVMHTGRRADRATTGRGRREFYEMTFVLAPAFHYKRTPRSSPRGGGHGLVAGK
jgi:hypothetical protein